jgi:hypothetical protein
MELDVEGEVFHDALEYFDCNNINVIATVEERSLGTQQNVPGEPWPLHR